VIPGNRHLMLVVLLVVCVAPGANADAADLPTRFGDWNVGFTLAGGFIDQGYDPGAKVRMPAFVKSERYASPMAAYYSILGTDELTDNPLIHGALFTHATLSARSRGLTLRSRLIMEHRGTSYGTYATRDIAVVPTFFASVDTSLVVGGRRLWIDLEGGNYDDRTLYEGLTVYNIDVQGYHFHVKGGHLKLSLDHISDLGVGIGLNIDDEADYAVSLEEVQLGGRLSLDASVGYVEYIGSFDAVNALPEDGMNVSAGIEWRNVARLYGQVGVRSAGGPSFGGIERTGDLVGLSYRGAPTRRLALGLTGEYRYYGRYFNEGHSSDGSCFLYRGYEGYGTCARWNFVGPQLYPIHVFDRPFSQWALYTDYEGRDVASFIGRADARYELPGGFMLACDLDFNYIDVSNEEPFLYPFYTLGCGWSPVEGTTIAVSHTNRAMNLDKQYPTLYLTRDGTIMFTLESRIAF
jgi:hypothetical protein